MEERHVCDFLIVGAGMAGASVGYELAQHGRVIVLEREDQPGYHSTGRSAAMFTETYGNATMRALARSGRAFYTSPPPGFAEQPILRRGGLLLVGTAEQKAALESKYAESAGIVTGLAMWSGEQVRERVPVFSPAQVAGAVWEPEAMDIDVHTLHQGYLRGLRARGGTLHCKAAVQSLRHDAGRWHARTRSGEFTAPVVVNAAGAWADELAQMAGARLVGLQPLRRTVITFDAPAGVNVNHWPTVIEVEENYYFKPDAGRLLASLADETPSPPCDAQPDEYDVALLVDRICSATSLEIRRIRSKWAGLRSFVADRALVVGYDAQAPGFFWLAGQGGAGIQTACGASRAAAALITGHELPADLQDFGLRAEDLSPARAVLAGR
jgi:D-arginine dehydrogenase